MTYLFDNLKAGKNVFWLSTKVNEYFSQSLLKSKNHLTPFCQWSDILWKNTKVFRIAAFLLFFLAKIFWIIWFDKVQRIKHWKLEILFGFLTFAVSLVITLEWIEWKKNKQYCIKFGMADSHFSQELFSTGHFRSEPFGTISFQYQVLFGIGPLWYRVLVPTVPFQYRPILVVAFFSTMSFFVTTLFSTKLYLIVYLIW